MEGRLAATLAVLAETLTSDYDVAQLLDTVMRECVGLLDVQASGLLLKNPKGQLELVASTSEAASFVEVMQLNAGDGPCVECARTGRVVSILDVEEARPEWAAFRSAALAHGFRSVHAVPLRVRDATVGSIGLFRARAGDLEAREVRAARALADLASIGIVQERAIREGSIVAEQLQRALDSRVLIEQAKGVLAASEHVDMDEAFRMLRAHARDGNRKLHDVAEAVVSRALRLGPSPSRAAEEAGAAST